MRDVLVHRHVFETRSKVEIIQSGGSSTFFYFVDLRRLLVIVVYHEALYLKAGTIVAAFQG